VTCAKAKRHKNEAGIVGASSAGEVQVPIGKLGVVKTDSWLQALMSHWREVERS
jgi:hypothetical protein